MDAITDQTQTQPLPQVPTVPQRNLLLEVPTVQLTTDQRTLIHRLLHEEGAALAAERARIYGAATLNDTQCTDIDRRVAALAQRLRTEFGTRPELAELFRTIFDSYFDRALLQVATGQMRVFGRERREALGLDGNDNDQDVTNARDAYLRRPCIQRLRSNQAIATYLNSLEQGAYNFTNQQFVTARWAAGQCRSALDRIGLDGDKFKNATASLTRYQLDLVYRYYARLSGGSNLMTDLRAKWFVGDDLVQQISWANTRFYQNNANGWDPYLYGTVVDADNLLTQYLPRPNLTEVTNAVLSLEPAEVISARLYMSLHGQDALAVAIECFMNVRSEDRQTVLRTFYRRFGRTYSELALESLGLEEGIAVRHLSEDGRVNEWEVTRVVNERAKNIGTEMGRTRALESGVLSGIADLEQRFQREVLDIYRNNPILVVRDEALRARVAGRTLAELAQSDDPQLQQVVAQVNRRMELLTQIRDAQALVAQQQGMLDVVTTLQRRLTMAERTPTESKSNKHLEEMLRERIEEYYRKHRQFLTDHPEFDRALRAEQDRVKRTTGESADRVIRAMADIEASTDRPYALGSGLFTDNDKVYAALKSLRTKEEREMLAIWYERKHGRSLRGLLENEFSGAELDKAVALLDGDLARAAAADIFMNMTSFWETCPLFGGRNTTKIEQFIRDVPPEDRHMIEEQFNRHYARRVTYTVHEARGTYSGSRGGDAGRSTTYHCTSFRDALGRNYRTDELNACVALLANNETEYRLHAVHNHLSRGGFSGPDREVGRILEQFYENNPRGESPFVRNPETGEWQLSSRRMAELQAFVTEYNRRFNTDLRADINRRCYQNGALWCGALLDGNLAAANAHRVRVAHHWTGNDRRMIMETFEVSAEIRALPENFIGDPTAGGRGPQFDPHREHNALVERRRRAIECQAALNARTESLYGQLYTGCNLRADLRSSLSFGVLWIINADTDGEILNTCALRRLNRGIATDTERLMEETQYTTFMGGVDGNRLTALTRGRSRAELTRMRAEANEILREAGSRHRSLDSLVLYQLTGDQRFDVSQNFLGEAETFGEAQDRALARLRHERSGLFMQFGTSTAQLRYNELAEYCRRFDRNRRLDSATDAERNRLSILNSNFYVAADNLRAQKNSWAEFATTVAVIAVSVAITIGTAGTLGPYMMMLLVAAASLGTTFLVKKAIRGDGFWILSGDGTFLSREMVTDIAFSAVDGALSAVGGRLLTPMIDRAANAFAKRFANSCIHRQIQRVGLLRGLKADTIERALAAESLVGAKALELAQKGLDSARRATLRAELGALRNEARCLVLEHARSLSTDVFTSIFSTGVQNAVNGHHESVGDFFREWTNGTVDRLKFGLPSNFVSTRAIHTIPHASHWVAQRTVAFAPRTFEWLSHLPPVARLTRSSLTPEQRAHYSSQAREAVTSEVNRRNTPQAPNQTTRTDRTAEEPIQRRTPETADPLLVARGLANPHPTGARPRVGRTVRAIIEDGQRNVAHLEHQLRTVVEGREPISAPTNAPTASGSPTPAHTNRVPATDPHTVRILAVDEARTAFGLNANDPALRNRAALAARKAELIAAVPARATDPAFLTHCAVLEAQLPVQRGNRAATLARLGLTEGHPALANNAALDKHIAAYMTANPHADPHLVRQMRRHLAHPEPQPPARPVPQRVAKALAALGLTPDHPALQSSTKLREYVSRLLLTDPAKNPAVANAAQQRLLRIVPPDTVADALALLHGDTPPRNRRLPTSEAQLAELGRGALARAGSDPQAQFAAAVAIQRLAMMIPPTDVAHTCRLIGGLNWATNGGFRPLLESRAALRAWFDTLTRGAPPAYRAAAKRHFDLLCQYVPPSNLAEARAHLGYSKANPVPATRSEVVAQAKARLAGPPPMEPAQRLAFARAVEMVLESIRPASLADHIYTLYLSDDVIAARKPVTGSPFDPDAHLRATAKLDALLRVAGMSDADAHVYLLDQRAAGALRDGRVLERHLDHVRTGANARETALINQSADALRDHVGRTRYHEALDAFGLNANSAELTNRRQLRAVCRKRIEDTPVDGRARLRQLQEALELHIPPSLGWKMLSWCLRRVGYITLHDALTRLNLLSTTGLSPDALSPDGLQAAYRTRRTVFERNLAEAPTARSQRLWRNRISALDDSYSVASRKIPFGTTNPEIVNALAALRLPQYDSYSAVEINRRASRLVRAAKGNVELIAEINGARALLLASLPDLPARRWYDIRAYTSDLVFGRFVRGFQHAKCGAFNEQVALARQRLIDYHDTLTTFGIGTNRRAFPRPQEIRKQLFQLLAADPNPTVQSYALLRAKADLLIEIIGRRSLVARMVVRQGNAQDLMAFANEGTQLRRTTTTRRGTDRTTERLVTEPTLAARAKIYEQLQTTSAECASRLGLPPRRIYSPSEIEAARTAKLAAAGADKNALIRIQADADLLLCLAGARPWSIPRGTPIGDAAHTLTLQKRLTDLYTAVYNARTALGMNIAGNPTAATALRAGLDGIDIVAAAKLALKKPNANIVEILANRDLLLAINDAHRTSWWSFGLRNTRGGGGQSVPSIETFAAYHTSRIEAMRELRIIRKTETPRRDRPLYTERDLAILRERRLTGVTDDAIRSRIEGAHDFLVADLRSGTAQTRYSARWRAYADTLGAPLSLPIRWAAAGAVWAVTKCVKITWGLATYILPGSATVTAAGHIERFVVHAAEAIYARLPRPLQRVCDATIGNVRRGSWGVDEWGSSTFRKAGAFAADTGNSLFGRRVIWSGDPTIETFQSRAKHHELRLAAVRRAETFLEGRLGTGTPLRDCTSLTALDKQVQGLLAKPTSDTDRLRILAARDQIAQNIIHRESGTLLRRDAVGAVYNSGRAYLFDYVIKLGALRAFLAFLENVHKIPDLSGVIISDGYEHCEGRETLLGATREAVARDPRLAPFLLADQDPYRAETPDSLVELFGGAQFSEEDIEIRENARRDRRNRDHLARNGRGQPHRFEPNVWDAVTQPNVNTGYMPADMRRAHSGMFLHSDVSAAYSDPLGPRVVVPLLHRDELENAILPPRTATTTVLDTSFNPTIQPLLGRMPAAPAPVIVAEHAFAYMTLDLPAILSPVTNAANATVSNLLIRPFRPTRLSEADAFRFGPINAR